MLPYRRYAYHSTSRLTNRWSAAKGNTAYAYDPAGNLTNNTDALGGQYVMVYSNRNERILERHQDGKEWTYTYDALLRVK